ncbi:hypothetical protein SELMODRAFT_409956 [Selaginella moellendorffii]|uniref:Uncharacterized protein n=1 Tax=Selaginella moellendorffii TaxID=88036 RepID=D8RD04_SELML|nr:hypothetical protein SELMODRAFT_409956 [Selaginella moellendorffii]
MEKLLEVECKDARSGLRRKSAGEWAVLLHLRKAQQEVRFPALGDESMSRIVSLAEEDLREAECAHEAMTVWRSDCWLPFAYDAELFNLLAVLYISRCLSNNHSEFQACLAHLHKTSSDDLQRLVWIGQVLGESAFLEDDSPAFATVERIWTTSPYESMQVGPTSTSVTDVVTEIIHSNYFCSFPSRVEGPNCATALVFIRSHIEAREDGSGCVNELRCLEDEVVDCYKRESVVLGKKEWEEYFRLGSLLSVANWGGLSSGQGKTLLSAMHDEQGSGLLASLCTQRPPQSAFLSHLFALFDCATHARLWLCKSTLPVYYAFSKVQYCNVSCSNTEEGRQVLASPLGFQERVPSYIERRQRWDAIRAHSDVIKTGEYPFVLSMRIPVCRVLRVPVVVSKHQDVDLVDNHDLAVCLDHFLWFESVSRLNFLFLAGGVYKFTDKERTKMLLVDQNELQKYYSVPEFLKAHQLLLTAFANHEGAKRD